MQALPTSHFVSKLSCFVFCILAFLFSGDPSNADEKGFDKLTLSEEFHSEGVAIADINRDGKNDIVSGPFWYAGPEFQNRYRYMNHRGSGDQVPADRALSIKGYSLHFFTWTYDFNGDKFPDVLTVGMPGDAAYWFENPGTKQNGDQNWTRHKVFDEISNESPAFVDINGDDKPELVCLHAGAYSMVQSSLANGKVTFSLTPLTRNLGYGRFTHGLGVGDVDGDGKKDLLETNGWWQQKEPGKLFQFHAYRFAQGGGAQMFAYDFDGDGDNDVICSQNAHAFGLKWFEQVRSDNKIDFVPRNIMTDKAADHPFGLAISQMHAATLADIDGDGIKDLVTGKRFWAHGGADPGSKQLPLLLWLKTKRKKERVIFEPKLIDVRSGVGTQVTVGDINQDGHVDVAVGSKLGTYVFMQNEKANALAWEDQPLLAGTKLFYENVRSTEPLAAEDQQKTFVLPQGFEIQLVASEPDIAKPMNLAFDRKGRMWVSSSREYPFAAKEGSKPRDAIKILEDTTGDGRADKVTTFADGMNIPMGLIPYGDGVICFSIPNIWYLRDTDGDDKVDKREILYGPFDTTRDTHGMCSSFRLGNDGWIYACHGFNNQSKVKGHDGHEVTMHSGNIFRFQPDGSRIEIVSNGQVNPFGMTIDSFGDIFTADCHTKPINLVLPGGHHDSFGKPHDGLGYIPNVMEHLHDSTGIGGVVLGENSAFPDIYQRSTFGGNVVTGRINRNHLVYRGSSMIAREESDFVIPGDPWFRPVNLQMGPDGALYIADFYNRIIGHYEVDLNHPGRDRERGRIWRVVYKGHSGRRDKLANSIKPVTLTKENLASLVQELGSANRSRAIAIVNWIVRQSNDDKKFLAEFVRLVLQGEDKKLAEGQTYWMAIALQQSNKLSPQLLRTFLQSEYQRVRCVAFQLLASFNFEQFPKTEFKKMFAKGLSDPSPHVRRFAALTAAKFGTIDLTSELLAGLADAHRAQDRYLVHSCKIALREQFLSEGSRLTNGIEKLEPNVFGDFADICMAVKSSSAAQFIVEHLERLADKNPSKLNAYLEFAARHADEASIDSVVKIARRRFSSNHKFQLSILDSLRTGLQQKKKQLPDSVKQLASQIARQLLRLPSQVWTPTSNPRATPFSTRQLRIGPTSQSRLFIDTLARGESSTGVLQSKPFLLKDKFVFRIAGHDGPKDQKPKRNMFRIKLATSGKHLATVFVPSNDVPKLIRIDTAEHQGETAIAEVIDGSNRKSFAWIAAGDFQSHPQLNPVAGWTVDPEQDALTWSCVPNENATAPASENIFVLTTRRNSSDGMKETPLWSSIVKGEKRTGVYRSEPFELDKSLRFYLAGHDGFPDKPHQKKNYVQLRLVSSGEVVHKTLPPRNDTAHPVNWDTGNWAGQNAVVEVVDGDDANAFAWLAVGRFSVPGLNPTQRAGDRKLAAQIISRFRLENLRSDILRLIETTKSVSLKSELCRTLVGLAGGRINSRSVFEVTAALVAFQKSDAKTVSRAIESIKNLDSSSAEKVIEEMFRKMSVAEQSLVAELLSSDSAGALFLVKSMENGLVAANVLSRAGLFEKLKAFEMDSINRRLVQLAKSIPKTDPELVKLIEARKKQFDSQQVNIANGKLVFEKNCASCHQIAGKGKQVGPNLDGIGNRGMDRLIDDILLPNRNVDAAFRASLIATQDGRVLKGLVKKARDEDSVLLVDIEGKESLVAKSDIENMKETKTSPMPANFGETLSAKDLLDLMGYLLSNRQ